MSTWDDPEFDGQQQQGNGPADLRKALEKAKAAEREAAEKAAKLETENRVLKVGSLLTQNGVDPSRFAQHVPSNLEPTEENVKGWIAANKDVFNFGPSKTEPVVDTAPQQQTQQQTSQQEPEQQSTDPLAGIDPKLIDALEKIGVISDRSQAASGAERQQLREQIEAAAPKSLEDAKDMLKGLGLEFQDTGGYRF